MDSLEKKITEYLTESRNIFDATINHPDIRKSFVSAAKLCIQAIAAGRKILIAGNGGSAADAQHFAAELVSRFGFDRPAIAALALTTDTSLITAIANDDCFTNIFSRQIEGLGQSGDVFIAISTSGNSKNIIEALKTAHTKNIQTIGLTGQTGGEMQKLCDVTLKIPSSKTPLIQQVHLAIEHQLCDSIENHFFGKNS